MLRTWILALAVVSATACSGGAEPSRGMAVAAFAPSVCLSVLQRLSTCPTAFLRRFSGDHKQMCSDGSVACGRGGGDDVEESRHTRLIETYQIDECAPNEGTRKLAVKNWENLALFMSHRPVAPHNREAFAQAKEVYENHCAEVGGRVPVILDSCCGTGMSSVRLAASRPDSFIVGIDKSVARLSRNRGWREGPGSNGIPRNLVLTRADCTDMWRSVWEEGWNVSEHFMMYPNPYPKRSDLSKRWHGSPSFPLMMCIGGVIEVRATWRTYLEELAIAADAMRATGTPPIGLVDDTVKGMTNFEIKYQGMGMPCYRMVLPKLPRQAPPP